MPRGALLRPCKQKHDKGDARQVLYVSFTIKYHWSNAAKESHCYHLSKFVKEEINHRLQQGSEKEI